MKKIILLCALFPLFSSCGQMQSILGNATSQNTQHQTPTPTSTTQNTSGALSNLDISNGLKQALELGIANGVDLLSQKDGYYQNQLVKILLPQELQKVDATLRQLGLGNLTDEGIKLLNRAAEGAVSKAKPIFISAVKNLSFSDATSILAGEKNAATQYLKNNTTQQLVQAFSPEIKASLDRVGANNIWSQIISKYNALPLVMNKVNPDLTGYVTERAIQGLFTQIEGKEAEIRQNIGARTTPLLQKVFGQK